MSTMDDDRKFMGTPDEAKDNLVARARAYRELRQPLIATAKEHRKREVAEHEAHVRLAEAALLWLWHEENLEAQ